ncbi:helix-turn-helix domain-containing protein [Actinomadura rayongensis]|uniref:Helix-turn-helix domain-containing protein n=1 Tax=Actinomadura rayongensis TaxID=1429076 RepID=A0A6I4W4I6_9ACTN|nr:helix-turn-helix transcriptional regulator [Actinomadura rayongensis]MXQ65599.1 helix-turn-helix domain-containing protein [Actinomadura rayongensis]
MTSARDFFIFHMKRLRDEHGLSQDALAERVDYTGKYIGMVETKRRRPSRKLAKKLDVVFGLPMFFEALLPRIAEEVGLPPGFWEYVDEEGRATLIRIYDQFIVPGLFQTEEYAREVLKAGRRPDRLEELVQTRLERQAVLEGEEPPTVIVVLEENAIRKVVGSREITRRQLEAILKWSQEPNITFYVVQAEAQSFPETSFVMLGFNDSQDVGYQDSIGGRGTLTEAGPAVTEMAVGFELIREVALSAADSAQLIREVMESL